MELIKNGKIVLNGMRTQKESEDLLLLALEIIVDKKVDMKWLKEAVSLEAYNYPLKEWQWLTQEDFDLLKEIAR